MPYLIVGIIIASFASGYGLSSALNKAELIKMHISIDAMNREAEWTLAALTKEADKAHEEALNLIKNWRTQMSQRSMQLIASMIF
jgi:hypothetical protein